MDWEKKKKKDQTICCLQEIHFKFKDTHWLKGMEKQYAKGNQKRIGVTILTRQNRLRKNCHKRQGHYIKRLNQGDIKGL